jgi:hypothetical protein
MFAAKNRSSVALEKNVGILKVHHGEISTNRILIYSGIFSTLSTLISALAPGAKFCFSGAQI